MWKTTIEKFFLAIEPLIRKVVSQVLYSFHFGPISRSV
jgi:hypothetical protein